MRQKGRQAQIAQNIHISGHQHSPQPSPSPQEPKQAASRQINPQGKRGGGSSHALIAEIQNGVNRKSCDRNHVKD
jgi:hypothetical protein